MTSTQFHKGPLGWSITVDGKVVGRINRVRSGGCTLRLDAYWFWSAGALATGWKPAIHVKTANEAQRLARSTLAGNGPGVMSDMPPSAPPSVA